MALRVIRPSISQEPRREERRDEAEEAVDPTCAGLAAHESLGTVRFVVFTRILFRASDLDKPRTVLDRIGSHTLGLVNVAPWVLAALAVVFAAYCAPRRSYASSCSDHPCKAVSRALPRALRRRRSPRQGSAR